MEPTCPWRFRRLAGGARTMLLRVAFGASQKIGMKINMACAQASASSGRGGAVCSPPPWGLAVEAAQLMVRARDTGWHRPSYIHFQLDAPSGCPKDTAVLKYYGVVIAIAVVIRFLWRFSVGFP